MLRRRLRELLVQLLIGDDNALQMTRAERRRWERRACWQRFHTNEDGKVSFVSIFTVLAFIVIIVLVTNTGITVSHKINIQNVADATAYSSALWEARSLNAITTTNHLMGELTALTVILDSFGGPMLGNTSYNSDLSKTWNDRIEPLEGEYTGTRKKYGLAAKYMADIDKQVVTFVVDLLTEDNGKHEAGAAIFDAKLTLKFVACTSLQIKEKANLVLAAAEAFEKTVYFAWVGYILEAVAVPTHLWMSGILVRVGSEWAYLEVTETAIGVLNKGNRLRTAMTEAVIPALSFYADGIVGLKLARTLGAAPFNQSVRLTQEKMVSRHALEAANTFPAWEEMRLPVVKEPPPVATQSQEADKSFGDWGFPPSEWSGNFTHPDLENISQAYETVRRKVKQLFGQFEPFLGAIADAAGAIADGVNAITGGGGGGVSEDVKEAATVAKKLKGLLKDLSGNLPAGPRSNGYDDNPCYQDDLDEKYRLAKFYWRAERRVQWVRATYPYVDEYRAPIISFFRRHCELSDAATYFAHWSNRYTLANSFQIRRLEDKFDSTSDNEEPHMYVLRGMHPEGKGVDEPWLIDDELAEDLFCITAYVSKSAPTVIGPVIFKHSNGDEHYAIASALVYNANGRDLEDLRSNRFQPNTGWDTLNWEPPVRAREWGDFKPSERSDVSPWQLMSPRELSPQNRVKLNWQVKLVPLTESRSQIVAELESKLGTFGEHYDLINH